MQLKKLKEEIKKKASKEPDKYYPTKTLREKGYERKKCINCGNHYWSTEDRKTCDEPECTGGYQFINNPPSNKKMDLIESWKSFKKHMEKRKYTPIKRYPIVARWRKDLYWTNASILDFQPHVVSGEVEPPANPLIVPQPCARFNDIDSVGISGRHNTSFIMTGQHAFKKPSEFEQEKYFEDYLTWFTEELKIPKKDLVIHEDGWGGGGNLGVSMEIFSRSLELGNQVYMNYKIKENSGKSKKSYEPLDIKVLDMGMGQERIPWLLTGKNTIYELQSPKAVKYLFNKTGLKETQTYKDFLPYSGIMNVDEIKNMEEGWKKIAEKIGTDKEKLKEEVTAISRLYSITDHVRTLLFAVTDGVLPSNTSGGHNLRTLYRRIHDFKEEQGWNIDLTKIAEKHAEYLEPIYPELKENTEELKKIMQNEEKKYNKTLRKTKKHIDKALKKEEITIEEMIDLYDTKGISPETIKRKAKEKGKEIKIPQNFYSKVTEKHLKEEEKDEEEIKKEEIDLSKYPKTKTLYHEENLEFKGKYEFKGRTLGNEKINGKNYVILNKTAFYPESGGQEPDHGRINGEKVKDVKKIEGIILHQTNKKIEKNKQIKGQIDKERREALAKHHTATHIINGAAKKTLGKHVWQAGAKKYPNRSRIDISHYEIPSKKQIKEIEEKANQAVGESIEIEKKQMTKKEAEEKYGFRIYQGGYVPGNKVRIVNIKNWDVEACGGTHCNNTSEVGPIKITNVSKKQDGVIRIEYIAGEEVRKKLEEYEEKLEEIAKIVKSTPEEAPEKVKKMQKEWKQKEKKIKELREKIVGGKSIEKNKEVIYMENADMKLMQKLADKRIKENPKNHVFVISKGKILGKKGPESKINIKEPVEKAAEIMGGSAGGNENEVKGGGPKTQKSKEAYEKIKEILKE